MTKTKRKILVTGGCGFIGSNLVNGFADAGHEVTVLDFGGKRFVALAMELFGRHGAEAARLMEEMGDAVAQKGGCKPMFMRAF